MAEHVQDLLPGYALGCLDEQELLQVARHLPRCADCRAELETYSATAEQLALATPVVMPPFLLKEKVLARVEQHAARPDQQAAGTAHATSSAQQDRKAGRGLFDWLNSKLGTSRLSWGAALALLLLMVLGVSNLLLWRQVNTLQTRVPAGNVQIVNLMGAPAAPSAQGYLMIFQNEPYGTLVVEDLAVLEYGYQYQLWLIRDGMRTSGGVFSVDDHGYGTLQIDADQPLKSFASFGVTVEPWGGSPGPTGEKVLGGDL